MAEGSPGVSNRDQLLAELDRLAVVAMGGDPAAISHRAAMSSPADLSNPTLALTGDDLGVRLAPIAVAAWRNVDTNQLSPGQHRARWFKQIVMRVARLFMNRQAEYNAQLLESIQMISTECCLLRMTIVAEHGLLQQLNEQINDVRAQLRHEMSRIDQQLTHDVSRLEIHLSSLEAQAGELDEMVGALSARLDHADRISFGIGSGVSAQDHLPLTVGNSIVPSAADEFYQRFEKVLRGDNADISARQEPYLADLEQVRHLGGLLVDVGCGRGEWLSFASKHGFECLGIDSSPTAIEECRRQGIDAVVADAITYLNSLPDDMVMAVTGFHIVEHLPPENQIQLIQAAYRALKPGGVLILETPNPTNVSVGAAAFYNDPTHLRPVNPPYLHFVFEDVGFSDVQVRFFRPLDGYSPEAAAPGSLEADVMWALKGPQDYAVIGMKPSERTSG